MEYQIGATDLRQKLTDVLQIVREKQAVYVIETFGRPQAALISMAEYQTYQEYRRERAAYFHWLDEAASANAELNAGLSESEVLALIDEARREVADEQAAAA